MLVNCPKCGFSQPKDQYCAKCGVDMQAYRPVEKSFLSQLLLNPALHISIIIILVVVSVMFIRGQQRLQRSQSEQLEKLSRGPVVIERNETTAAQLLPPPPTAPTPEGNPPPPTAPVPPPRAGAKGLMAMAGPNGNSSAKAGETGNANSEGGSDNPAATTAGNAAPANAFKKGVNKSQPLVRLMLAEVDTTTLDRWAMKMQAAGQYNSSEIRMGALPNIQSEIDSDRSIVIYEKQERNFDAGTPLEFTSGRGNGDQLVGFRSQVNVVSMDKNLLHVELKVVRTLEASDPKVFEAEFELPPQTGWVFSDLLSHQFRPDTEDEMNPKSFFQILSSDRFKKLRTQFTMLFVFDRPLSK